MHAHKQINTGGRVTKQELLHKRKLDLISPVRWKTESPENDRNGATSNEKTKVLGQQKLFAWQEESSTFLPSIHS